MVQKLHAAAMSLLDVAKKTINLDKNLEIPPELDKVRFLGKTKDRMSLHHLIHKYVLLRFYYNVTVVNSVSENKVI